MKMSLERKARDAEFWAHRIMQETERHNYDSYICRAHLYDLERGWTQDWGLPACGLPVTPRYMSHQRLLSSSSCGEGNGYVQYPDDEASYAAAIAPLVKAQSPSLSLSPFLRKPTGINYPPPDPSSNQMIPTDLVALRSEIEKSRADYNEKKKSLQEKMNEFRNEIESLKVEERQSEHDRIHAANVQLGIDKYSTLRKSSAELHTFHGHKVIYVLSKKSSLFAVCCAIE
ncbi:unnamed protein product [Gongylonema pulchrum]|uniref:ERM domain-containing protein n=1 Tax=Gongylonema pulchrum TaxID=637853 RepID=A0A183EG66_9BILA|nr:unnamed protein product [Gongylonema pulchrum]